jgi:hypothetical protein
MRRWLWLLIVCGCIRAPEIVVVDHATALERQAAGTFPKLELELADATTVARPVPFTREELVEHGASGAQSEAEAASEADEIDGFLRARCIGEALDGSLVETRETCTVKERSHLRHLVEHANRDRTQIWQAIATRRPGRSLADIRRAWRTVHLGAVVCGAQVERDGGGWELKKC